MTMKQLKKKPKTYWDCQIERRMLITSGSLDINTGEITNKSQRWEVRACRGPLFGDDEKQRGACRSCVSGWTHENNYPTANGLARIMHIAGHLSSFRTKG
jgi:hypothetical protein